MEDNKTFKKFTSEEIGKFMEGKDDEKRIVNLLYKSKENFITIVYRNERGEKCTRNHPFFPFAWATKSACLRLCDGNRTFVKSLMNKYKIGVKKLSNINYKGEAIEEFEKGYMFMFFAKEPMSYNQFLSFFKDAGNPIYSNKKDKNLPKTKSESNQYLIVTAQEQFLISTGKRFFKGYDDYDEVYRMEFDLETEGLDPTRHRINQIGVRTNKGFEKILSIEGNTEEEKNKNEFLQIENFLKFIYTYSPDILTGHNVENFDWWFFFERCKYHGVSLEEISAKYFKGESIHKEEKESILKLGGEIETFHATVVPGIITTDSLHAVRRAQATDSNFQQGDLKYATKYLGINKRNRVYTPGDKISIIWNDTENQYAFNDFDGSWYIYDESSDKDNVTFNDKKFSLAHCNKLLDGYEIKTGRYIIERYLLDDLWEGDKVEKALNATNFLICKILPLPFKKCTTMGTAGQWKALMLSWSYENNLAIPMAENTGAFTGGLSRLLSTGSVKNVAKFDYNSLYPSIILTWGISDKSDLLNGMLNMLEYVLTTREKFKGVKKAAKKIVDAFQERINNGETLTQEEENIFNDKKAEYELADKKQLQMKILGNSFFGAYGSNNGSVFPWKSPKCAEQTTCIGRQSLRLMISHFNGLSYRPIVGDSFTPDTPLFIKSEGLIDIKPVEELINESEIKIDELGREYDYSKKPYKVLCRSGWVKPSYIYRHKTDKDIYEVKDGDMMVEVTEDHSLFDSNKNQIKPSEIIDGTKLEYYEGPIVGEDFITVSHTSVNTTSNAVMLAEGKIDRVPKEMLNCYNKKAMKVFYGTFIKYYRDDIQYSKTCIAGLQYLKRMMA